jgi:hypothetical protein
MGVGNFWSDRPFAATDVSGEQASIIGSMGMDVYVFVYPRSTLES